MSDELNDRLNEAKARMEAEERLRAERVHSEDTLTQEEYHLRRLEVGVARLREELEAIENPGLTGIFRVLFGGGDKQLEHARAALDATQREYETLDAAVVDIRAKLETVEQQIDELGDTRADFDALCVQKEQRVLDRGGASADQLREVLGRLAWFKEEARKTHLAVDATEAVLKRISAMYKALMRVRKGHIHVLTAPVVGSAWNVLKARGVKEHVSRVRDGIQKLHHQLTSLDIASEARHDLEITRMTPMIEHYTEELVKNWEQWAVMFADSGHPMELEVNTLLGHLEERLAGCRTEADTLERQRHHIIENA